MASMNYFFNPSVLECRRFVTENRQFSSERITKDYEFDYYLSGDRQIYIDDEYFHIHKGSLVTRKPGQHVYSYGDYDCYILTLDFSGTIHRSHYSRNTARRMQPINTSPMWDIIPPVFTPAHGDDYVRIFKQLVAPPLTGEPHDNKQNLINELLHLIITDALRDKSHVHEPKPLDAIEQAYKYMNRHFKEAITLDNIADHVHLNKNYLLRSFKKRYGITPIKFLIGVRMDNAKMLLSETDLSVSEIAERCGYNNAAFFCSTFKKLYSITPNQYRNTYMLP